MIAEAFLACALAMAPVGGWRPPLGDADHTVMRCLRAMTEQELVFIHRDATWQEFNQIIWHAPKGSFILIARSYASLKAYFNGRDYELLPFMWRDYMIYRKRGREMA